MQPGYICVVGVSLDTGGHVRPVLQYGRLTTGLLRCNGGPFDIASVVDLGPTREAGCAPEVEDLCFDPARASWLMDDDLEAFWELLQETSCESLVEIFGPDLERRGRSCTVDPGGGHASLGCLKPTRKPELYVNDYGSIRLRLTDPTPSVDLSVTDLRLCEEDHRTPRWALISNMKERIRAGVGTILSVGLTRPWQKQDDTRPRHWLQVNNIHLEDDPGWR